MLKVCRMKFLASSWADSTKNIPKVTSIPANHPLVGDVDDKDSQLMRMMMIMTTTVCISMLQFIVLLKASRGRAGLFIASSLRNMLSLSRSRSRSRSYHQQSQWCDVHNHFTLNIIIKVITTCTSHREQGSRCQETWWRRVDSAIFWNWNFLNLFLTMTWPAILIAMVVMVTTAMKMILIPFEMFW